MKPRRGRRDFSALLGLFVPLALLAPAGVCAQENQDGYLVVEEAAPPVPVEAEPYLAVAARARAETEAVYVVELEGLLTDGRRAVEQPAPEPVRRAPDFNAIGVFATVALVVGAILLWLKFGGAGVLLSREPSEVKPQTAPEGWALGAANPNETPLSLLERIAGMSDRNEAMILLLRHCLLAAADKTGTRFARSDTERRAFSRLPGSWRFHEGLNGLLRRTELAHYGGRPVSENDFTASLDMGRLILKEGASYG